MHDVEEVVMRDFNMAAARERAEHRRRDASSEEDSSGPRWGCAQQ